MWNCIWNIILLFKWFMFLNWIPLSIWNCENEIIWCSNFTHIYFKIYLSCRKCFRFSFCLLKNLTISQGIFISSIRMGKSLSFHVILKSTKYEFIPGTISMKNSPKACQSTIWWAKTVDFTHKNSQNYGKNHCHC